MVKTGYIYLELVDRKSVKELVSHEDAETCRHTHGVKHPHTPAHSTSPLVPAGTSSRQRYQDTGSPVADSPLR